MRKLKFRNVINKSEFYSQEIKCKLKAKNSCYY